MTLRATAATGYAFALALAERLHAALQGALQPTWLEVRDDSHLHAGHMGDDGTGETRHMAGDEDQPPHRQAAAYYQERAAAIGGEFKVTMEHPDRAAPKPIVVTIDRFGATLKRAITVGAPAIISRPAPRAG